MNNVRVTKALEELKAFLQGHEGTGSDSELARRALDVIDFGLSQEQFTREWAFSFTGLVTKGVLDGWGWSAASYPHVASAFSKTAETVAFEAARL